MKKSIIMLGILCILAACQSDAPSSLQPQPRKDISLTRSEREIADAGADFAFRFFKQVCKTGDKESNLFVSPLSTLLCLSMMTNGAAENTLLEMKSALGFSNYSLEELNEYNRKLVSELLGLDNTVRIGIANSIWIKQGLGVYDSFVEVNKRMYDAQVKELDFTSPGFKDIINGWCAEKTNGCIKEVIQEIPDNACLYLLNALYFKGIWKNQFKKSNTVEEQFRNVDGSKSDVRMMNMTKKYFEYAENDYFSMAVLPYGNEAFSMVVLLPSEGKSLEESLSQLDDETWKEWSQDFRSSELDLKFPRFELKYNKDLIKDMRAMGMYDAFDSKNANFSGMSDEDLFISILEQYSYIKVDEEGTEAAAVTEGAMTDSMLEPGAVVAFHVNRPFAFLIKEKSTGAILFMGKVTKL